VLIGRQANGQLTGNTINANFITGVDISKRNKDKEDEEAASKLVNNTINYNLEAGIKLWYDACVELDKNNITANMQEIKISPRYSETTAMLIDSCPALPCPSLPCPLLETWL
jgi:parallel beta-helix repeat protein